LKVLVLGAGVVGVSTAWYLAKAGFQVEVIDRCPGPGREASFANGGQVSPCHSEPWANPATPMKALRWLGQEDAPLVFRWQRWDPALWLWTARFLANCGPSQTATNTARALRIALYSRGCLQALRGETGLQYDQQTSGILHIYRDQHEFSHAVDAAEVMSRQGLTRHVKTVAEAVAIEPALADQASRLSGAIFTPDDESGDAYVFTERLAGLCAEQGVRFHYDCTIHGMEWNAGKVSGVATDHGRFTADAYVLALGCWSPLIASQVGIRLPIYPAKGYSATIDIGATSQAPVVSITDDEYKVVFSRLGNRLRCAGTAEFAGWDGSITESRARALVRHARSMFPGAGDFERAALWAGLRPATPDSVPILGATGIPNFFLNTGHGTLGWTMCCGSAKILADVIAGRPADIDLEGLGIDRFTLWRRTAGF
jgi:D-amino-acid dehydrogenase